MTKVRPLRPRLMPVVITAAVSLLALKVVGLATQGGYLLVTPRPEFGRALSDVRKVPDWATDITGSNAAKPTAAPKPAEPAQPLPPAPVATPAAEREVLETLGARRKQLDEKSRELELREQLLKSAEKVVQDRLDDVRKSEAPSAAEPKPVDGLKSLASMYETMKPREAARVFEKMDGVRLLPLARQMNPKKLAEVLAAMTPESAERLTGLMLPAPIAAPKPAPPPQLDELPRLPMARTNG